jgi:hypothetical protein
MTTSESSTIQPLMKSSYTDFCREAKAVLLPGDALPHHMQVGWIELAYILEAVPVFND